MAAPKIIFSDNMKKRILESLGIKRIDKDILVGEDNHLVADQNFEPLTEREFGGILQGSKIAIKNEESAVVKYFADRMKRA